MGKSRPYCHILCITSNVHFVVTLDLNVTSVDFVHCDTALSVADSVIESSCNFVRSNYGTALAQAN